MQNRKWEYKNVFIFFHSDFLAEYWKYVLVEKNTPKSLRHGMALDYCFRVDNY